MTHSFKAVFMLLPLAAGVGCASTPAVESRLATLESRLSTLQFHPNMYVVQAGDTRESIAYRYQLSTDEVAQLNPGLGERLEPGLRINVRPGTELPEAVRTRSDGWESAGSVASTPDRTEPFVATTSATRGAAVAPAPRMPVTVTPAAVEPAVSAPVTDVALLDVEQGYASDFDDSSLDAPGYPREEIVPDDFDITQGQARSGLGEELQSYVGRWTWPTDGAVARGFAPGQPNGQGVDIAGVPGQDVRAALDGKVVYSGRDLSGGGNLVIVRHDDELMTTYSHTDRLFVAEDDEVLAGDPIASLGWNGDRESVLRFEVRREGQPLDPMVFLPASP